MPDICGTKKILPRLLMILLTSPREESVDAQEANMRLAIFAKAEQLLPVGILFVGVQVVLASSAGSRSYSEMIEFCDPGARPGF